MARLKILVTGRVGQLVSSLIERADNSAFEVVTLGRPQIDFLHPDEIPAQIEAIAPAIVVNAAGHTAVDQAESEREIAQALNVTAAGVVAEAAARLGVPVVHISTDFVFDGRLDRAYREDDATAPLNVYGQSKLDGETRVRQANADHAIIRTSWVFSPFGKNFVKTMLALGQTREEIAVVADQIGAPTYAPDLADGILRLCHNLITHPDDTQMRGLFHLTGGGATSWAEFAAAIFEVAGQRGRPAVRVRPIPASDYPTPAKRPANSRLDNSKIARIHGIRLPAWQDGVARCVDRLIS